MFMRLNAGNLPDVRYRFVNGQSKWIKYFMELKNQNKFLFHFPYDSEMKTHSPEQLLCKSGLGKWILLFAAVTYQPFPEKKILSQSISNALQAAKAIRSGKRRVFLVWRGWFDAGDVQTQQPFSQHT